MAKKIPAEPDVHEFTSPLQRLWREKTIKDVSYRESTTRAVGVLEILFTDGCRYRVIPCEGGAGPFGDLASVRVERLDDEPTSEHPITSPTTAAKRKAAKRS